MAATYRKHLAVPQSLEAVQLRRGTLGQPFFLPKVIAVKMLHQKLSVLERFLRALNQLAYAVELALDAELDNHVFRESLQAGSQALHLSHLLPGRCTVRSSKMASWKPLDRLLRTFQQIHLQRYQHHFHLESIHNLDELIVACP